MQGIIMATMFLIRFKGACKLRVVSINKLWCQAKSWSDNNKEQQQKGRNYGNTFIFCERPPHTMANAIRARGIATFLKCSQKQQAQSNGNRVGKEEAAVKGGHKLATTSWKSFGQQAVAALARHGHGHGCRPPCLLCVVVIVVVVLVYQLARTFLLTFVIFTRELRYLRPGCTRTCGYWGKCSASDSCRLLQARRLKRAGVGQCPGLVLVLVLVLVLGPLVTVLKLSNMPPWTAPQQLTDKCRWPGSKYCCKHFLISWHPARPSLRRTVPPLPALSPAASGTANF